jgi:hypothetical protein
VLTSKSEFCNNYESNVMVGGRDDRGEFQDAREIFNWERIYMSKKEKSIGDLGERTFFEACNKWGCECLRIHQEPEHLSSEMYSKLEKRPDFIVNIPNVGPLFVDVKVRKLKKKDDGPLQNEYYFTDNHETFSRAQNFQNHLKVNTWFAFIENKIGDDIDGDIIYLCPISRMEKFIPAQFYGDHSNWGYVSIPRKCTNRCEEQITLGDPCHNCRNKVCERVREAYPDNKA